jgi:hypothetical protein
MPLKKPTNSGSQHQEAMHESPLPDAPEMGSPFDMIQLEIHPTKRKHRDKKNASRVRETGGCTDLRAAGSCSADSSVDGAGAGRGRRLLRRRPAMGSVAWPRESAARRGVGWSTL